MLKDISIPVPEDELLRYSPPIPDPTYHPKVQEFHRFMSLIMFEIRAQMFAIKAEALKTKEPNVLVNYARIYDNLYDIDPA